MQQRLEFNKPGGPPKTYSVVQLVRMASRKLEAAFGDVWVEGELSNLSTPSSGHVYFTLKDQRAQLSVVLFRGDARRLRFSLEPGQRLRCRGKLGIYDAQGRFQLTAQSVEPAGVGDLQLAFEQLKNKLEREGLFDPSHKRPLPRLPRGIAVVTSPTGAALHDILQVLHNRCPVRVVVCPTPVQGSEAPVELVRAIRRADKLGLDLMIVGRGGGSLEDLWAFNNEGVARAIHAARTPVISAVGHEVDLTIADLVADHRAPTPSAAAEAAVPVAEELQQQLEVSRARLMRAARHRLRSGALQLERLNRRLGTPATALNRGRQSLDAAEARLRSAMVGALGRRRAALNSPAARLATQEPRVRLGRHRAALIALQGRLTASTRRILAARRGALAGVSASLRSLGPQAVLERGYALVTDQGGALVRSAKQLARKDRLILKFYDGEAWVSVETTAPTSAASKEHNTADPEAPPES
jgi:exodeoxyribonuclease VII large subunit